MAEPFHMSAERQDDTLTVTLRGDFTPLHARKVVALFTAHPDGVCRIVVDTTRLNHPDPLELILLAWASPEGTP